MSFTKEEEIRPRNIFKELLECCRIDALNFAESGQFEEVFCPGCGGNQNKEAFIKNRFRFVNCEVCNTLFNSPRPTKVSFNQFYPQSLSSKHFFEVFYPTVEASRKVKLIPQRAQKIVDFLMNKNCNNGVILDVGGGQGYFFDVLKMNLPGFDFRIIEPNIGLAEICRSKGYKTIIDFVENVDKWQGEIDFITCFEVFEHIREPENFILKLKKLLKPGGTLLITSLSRDGLDIKLLNENADIVAPPQHLNYLSIKGYTSLFNRLGFCKTEIQTPGKLDVNIVINKVNEDPELFSDSFYKFLADLSDNDKNDFQSFLATHLLSSHVWVFAQL